MPPSTDRVYDLARTSLEAIVAGWPGDATGLPDRQYVSNGLVIWDCCEQLAVQVERTYAVEADPSQELIQAQSYLIGQRAMTMAIWLIRRTSDLEDDGAGNISIPTADEIDADAQIILLDSQAITNVLVAAQRAGDIASCGGLAFRDWEGQGPEGGLGGGVLRVSALLL